MTERVHSLHRGKGALLCVGLVFALAVQRVPSALAAESGPPVRAARLTFVQGSVTAASAENPTSAPAQLNLPLLAGVRLATGADGQAEIEFEDGSVVRLTPNSELSLDTLAVDPAADGAGVFTTGISLLRGLAYVELRAAPQYRYSFNAGGDRMVPVENSTVRVNFDEPPAEFAVLDGVVQVGREGDSGGSGREVRSGESLRSESAQTANYTLASSIAEDTWDAWNEDRDSIAAGQAASRTAARDNFAGAEGYGWSDLDANGSWYDVPGQGMVWQPAMADSDSGFDPYGNGAWVYSGGGYLWASGYPWGWTPYRCGNWSFYGGFGWGWSPGIGCGGLGWAVWGGGRPVNILVGPNGYRLLHVPRPRPGPIQPVVPVRLAANPVALAGQTGWGAAGRGEPRNIGGVSVVAMEPIGSGFVSRGAGRGSALERDFPVDRTTHAAVIGRVATQAPAMHTSVGWVGPAARPAAVAPAYTGRVGLPAYRPPAGAVRTAPSSGQVQRPNYTPVPVQRSAPPPAAAPRAAPAPAPAARPR